MIQSVIMILIACVIAALLYGVAALAKMNPELINGFKWGETPEEKVRTSDGSDCSIPAGN